MIKNYNFIKSELSPKESVINFLLLFSKTLETNNKEKKRPSFLSIKN